MLKWIIGSSLKFRFIVVAIAAGMMFFGIRQLQKMPVDVFPEFAPPRVEVQTEGPGLSTEEVEELLTIPLEERLAGIPGLVVMRSKTVPSLSSIVLFFELGTDLMLARQLVNERLALTIPELPTVVSVPMMIQPLSATSRAMKIGITSEELNLIELSTIAFWKIRPRLMAVHGVRSGSGEACDFKAPGACCSDTSYRSITSRYGVSRLRIRNVPITSRSRSTRTRSPFHE